MSAYNRIELSEREACPNCGSGIVRVVQFKYGEVRQHTYRVGDPLLWGENNVGAPGPHKVIASGHPEACPVCGDVPEFRYEVLVEDDVVAAVNRASADSEYERFRHESFIVLEH